ncbi:hypothetical protein HaLaN_09812 [Haematococcus lacustris]|uniref:Uncharacterized protein n=1 Tax=Haematococcus lacustris TaxID=44745 RepID=A0A699Z3L4_HAELA|nr:hypothetical protein HaLaN_09812 [Haematococcus lacustris]
MEASSRGDEVMRPAWCQWLPRPVKAGAWALGRITAVLVARASKPSSSHRRNAWGDVSREGRRWGVRVMLEPLVREDVDRIHDNKLE